MQLTLILMGKKSRVTIIFDSFIFKNNQTLISSYFSENVYHWSNFKARSREIFFS